MNREDRKHRCTVQPLLALWIPVCIVALKKGLATLIAFHQGFASEINGKKTDPGYRFFTESKRSELESALENEIRSGIPAKRLRIILLLYIIDLILNSRP